MIAHEIANFITVLATAVLIASTIGGLYASGLRLWIAGEVDAEGNAHLLHLFYQCPAQLQLFCGGGVPLPVGVRLTIIRNIL